ncbi:5-formyltetrahydrofolate cyclo-ligase [Prochlorococcus marinus str. MIT 9201]|uniref:5-formyltetrahydrofolate cyclo-ligase n=1 Tax=Prochlorococcus marinus str. MIT 9201 TaxID=93057 RepID=A0A0A2A2U8_PROMR|nr:5-formyltetrahydrofolate cyclo-ligase [Prochlorococcus marinus]KGF95161.1 5-formyltetrahydrofolate cyclo-ligase [Prochlorococcus marinus str. MIT 9201]
MTISEKKKLERDIFRRLRDEVSINQRENVEKKVKSYVDSFIKKSKNIGYIAIYWPLKNEVDIRSLKEKISLALPRCTDKKDLLFYPWDEKPLTKDSEGILSPNNSFSLSYEQISMILVPCLSIDKNLIRLGYGGGYFDKLRRDKNWRNVPCLGVLASNCVSRIPLTRAEWDIPLSGFITEKEIFV